MNFTLAERLHGQIAGAARVVYVKVEPRGLQVQIGNDTTTDALARLLAGCGATEVIVDSSATPRRDFDGGWRRNVYAHSLIDGARVEIYGGQMVPAPPVEDDVEDDAALCTL